MYSYQQCNKNNMLKDCFMYLYEYDHLKILMYINSYLPTYFYYGL